MRLGARITGVFLVITVLAFGLSYLVGRACETASTGHASTESADEPIAPRRPNILLFTVDTLRADHLSAYGYARETSPAMSALAGRGTRFDRAHSTSSWTVPAVASLVTGVIPSEHGVFHGHPAGNGIVEQECIPSALPTIATVLHDAGYRTIGRTTNGHLAAEFGFARDFDSYENFGFGEADEIRAALDPMLSDLRGGEAPFFLWVHVVDPHVPYLPVEPQFSTWWPSTSPRYPALEHMTFAPTFPAIVRQAQIPPADGLQYIVAAYDSEIRHVDDLLAHLLEQLDDGRLAVVITADHGEEFLDHHGLGHGSTLFEELVRVPLVVAAPGQRAGTSSALVSIVDVLPTIAEIADTPVPAGPTGRSLMPTTRGETIASAPELTFESGRAQPLLGIMNDRYKYGMRLGPTPLEALFDLMADPDERHPCGDSHPEVLADMRDRMNAILAQARERRGPVETVRVEIPAHIREQLEALGYGN